MDCCDLKLITGEIPEDLGRGIADKLEIAFAFVFMEQKELMYRVLP